jgi:predicted amidohydrolase YtcJ
VSASPRPIVVRGGLVRSLDASLPTAEAVVVDGARIAAVLPRADDAPAGAQVVDVDGGCVLPAFTDAHVHLPTWALARRGPDLRHAGRLDEALDSVGRWLAADQVKGIARARGWQDELWPAGDSPTRWALDAVAPDRPVMLKSYDSHSMWLNSAALALADGDLETPGGIVERRPDGEPTGILREDATARFEARFPPTPDEALSALRAAIPELSRAGVVAIHDKDGHRGSLGLFRVLARGGELPLRVWQSLPAASFEELLDADAPHRVDEPDLDAGATVRVGYVKVFMDGTLGSRTALLLDGSGVEVTSTVQLMKHIRRAAAHRLPVAVHAIGDQAVRNALDAFERTRDTWLPLGLRHRIEHAQCVHPDDLARFAELGVVASVQFTHATSDRDLAGAIWGSRAAYSYPYRSLLDAGALLVGGSDAPCEKIDPLAGIRAAVLRTSGGRDPWRPEQRIAAPDALSAFTQNPAWLEGAEAFRGRLAPGLAADLVVLDRDPVDHLGDAQVRSTMLAGRWIHKDAH